MTREYKCSHQAAQWFTFESWIKEKEFLRLYLRAEVIHGCPDLTEVYRRAPMTIFEYSSELNTFFHQLQLHFAKSDFDKRMAEFELSVE